MEKEEHKVKLRIQEHVILANKETLCEYSDYFKAMFSGNYVENDRKEIDLNMVSVTSMKEISGYMEHGCIDLTQKDMVYLIDLCNSATYLQMTELCKQIEYTLETMMNIETFTKIIRIAKIFSFRNLEKLAVTYGLTSLNQIDFKSFDDLATLFWLISHPYLLADSELDLFKFALNCLSQTAVSESDSILIALGCLDIKKLSYEDFSYIKNIVTGMDEMLTTELVNALYDCAISCTPLTKESIFEQETSLINDYSIKIYEEICNLVIESKSRVNKLIPVVSMSIAKNSKILEDNMQYLYTFKEETGFEKWLEVAEKGLWGWSATSWGLTKIVVVGGERGRGCGVFVRNVKVYHTIKEEWIIHGVELPCHRHAGIAILNDCLYIIGGVGTFRVVLDSVVMYDLNNRSFRTVAKLPDAIQSPGTCTHEGVLYAAGHKNVYRYQDPEDRWLREIETEFRIHCMTSFKGYIYCTQNYFGDLYRFRPDAPTNMELLTCFTNPVPAICNLGDRLLAFTCNQSEVLSVEEFCGKNEEKPKIFWSESDVEGKINEVSGSCAIVQSALPCTVNISNYVYRLMSRYCSNIDDYVKNRSDRAV